MFIIWDRLFGTYADETETPVYGVVHPLQTNTPMWVQLHHPQYVAQVFWNTPGLYNKIKLVFFKQAGWYIGKDGKEHCDSIPNVNPKLKRFDIPIPSSLTLYLFAQFLVNTVCTAGLLDVEKTMNSCDILVVSAYLLYSIQVCGMAFNRKPSAQLAELIRLVFASLVSVYILLPNHTWPVLPRYNELPISLIIAFIYVVISTGCCLSIKWPASGSIAKVE